MNEVQLEILAKALEGAYERGYDRTGTIPERHFMSQEAATLAAQLEQAAWCFDMDKAPRDGTFDVITDYGLECVMKRGYGDKIVRNVTCRRCDGMGLGSLIAWRPRPLPPVKP